jgi:hypothetical protein
MKKNIIYYILSILFAVSLAGCENYLEIPVEAGISEEDIFSTYIGFQGFQDQMATMMRDYTRGGARRVHALGGECVAYSGFSVTKANLGNYGQSGGGMMSDQGHGIFMPHNEGSRYEEADYGLYTDTWKAIRITNVCLDRLNSDILVDATEDQRKWLKGQALFYRAFWHYEYVRIWGTIPYVDTLIGDGQEYEWMNRHWSYEKGGKTYNDCQAVLERIVEDMEAAAELLPLVWPSPIVNWGRPTSIAAKGYIAKALQHSASPLFNQLSTGNSSAGYDNDLLARCIVACQEVIDLAKSAEYAAVQLEDLHAVNPDGLTPMENYGLMYARMDGEKQPGTPEVLWKKPNGAWGAMTISQTAGRSYGDFQLTRQHGAQGNCQYADKFEMADGTRYRKAYDTDPAKRWKGRDPRFYKVFYTHGDTVGNMVLNQARGVRSQTFNCFVVRKYWAEGANNDNKTGHGYATPYLRVADIYLTYAEAAYELLGDYTTVPTGGTLTAEQAVNIVRSRAGMPDVATALADYSYLIPESEEDYYQGNLDPFRVLYRNERCVELAYEGSYWYDIRRWKIAHYKDGTPIEILVFDLVGDNKDVSNPIDESTMVREKAQFSGEYVFKDAHYWMPFRDDIIFFNTTWEQNPGW